MLDTSICRFPNCQNFTICNIFTVTLARLDMATLSSFYWLSLEISLFVRMSALRCLGKYHTVSTCQDFLYNIIALKETKVLFPFKLISWRSHYVNAG